MSIQLLVSPSPINREVGINVSQSKEAPQETTEMPRPPDKIEETIHDLLDDGMTSVPAIAGRVMGIYGSDVEGIDTVQDLIASINQAKQTYDEE